MYHILHVLRHGSTLTKREGFIVCKGADGIEQTLPYADVRAVVIAARGVSISSNFLSAILDGDGIVLHCNERYQPCGLSAPLARIVDRNACLAQAARPEKLNARIWNALLRRKTENQIQVLRGLGIASPRLERALASGPLHEGDCAKTYWRLFFPHLGSNAFRARSAETNCGVNHRLNYGYAVLSALCHRSLLIHGLSPLFGVQHTTRYRTHPLVYDVMEPFRQFVDRMLAEFQPPPGEEPMKAWCKHVGSSLRECRVHHPRYSIKLMDAIDVACKSLADGYAARSVSPLWLPAMA